MTLYGFIILQIPRLLSIILRQIYICCFWVEIGPNFVDDNLFDKFFAEI
jgi:hypothetical protein